MIDNFFLYSAIISTGLMSIPKTRYPTLTNDHKTAAFQSLAMPRPGTRMVRKSIHSWNCISCIWGVGELSMKLQLSLSNGPRWVILPFLFVLLVQKLGVKAL